MFLLTSSLQIIHLLFVNMIASHFLLYKDDKASESKLIILLSKLLRDAYELLSWLSGKESPCQCRSCRRCGFSPWVGKMSWRTKWQPTPIFLPGKSHGQRSLVGYIPWGCKESDMTERLNACTQRSSAFIKPVLSAVEKSTFLDSISFLE